MHRLPVLAGFDVVLLQCMPSKALAAAVRARAAGNAQVAAKMSSLHNEQRVLRSAVEAELSSARSACAAAIDSAQVSLSLLHELHVRPGCSFPAWLLKAGPAQPVPFRVAVQAAEHLVPACRCGGSSRRRPTSPPLPASLARSAQQRRLNELSSPACMQGLSSICQAQL